MASYESGGHYAPHFDNLVLSDYEMQWYGNRLATFMLVLKTAHDGGSRGYGLGGMGR